MIINLFSIGGQQRFSFIFRNVHKQHSLTLVTRDAHFDEIEGLATEAW